MFVSASARPMRRSVPVRRASRHERLGVSVVIPVKNEAGNLPWVLERLPRWVDEVIVVDGESTDGTPEVARRVRPDVVLVDQPRPGKGAALRAGFEAATGDVVVMIDADGSMDPAEIGRYVDAIARGADLAKGSRRMAGGGSADITPIRDLGNRGLLLAANLLYGTRFTELCYGFMALHRPRMVDLALAADGFEIEAEVVTRAVREGLTIAEVPSFESPRRSGESNLNAVRDGLRIVRTLLTVRLGRGRTAPDGSDGAPAAGGARHPRRLAFAISSRLSSASARPALRRAAARRRAADVRRVARVRALSRAA